MFEIKDLRYKNILDIPQLMLDHRVTCIVGASGSGKTTLLRLLNRLDEPEEGGIYYNSVPLTQIEPVALRRRVVMLGQSPVIYEGNIADNLQAGLRFSQKEDVPPVKLEEVLERVGLAKSPEEFCDKLSGGEKQRLCLARVLLMDAETYLLDEPSAALDSETEHFLISNLAEHVRRFNKQLILVTHSMQVASMFREGVIELHKNKKGGNLA